MIGPEKWLTAWMCWDKTCCKLMLFWISRYPHAAQYCTELSCSVLTVTDMWHLLLRIWVCRVVLSCDSWHLEGTHYLHLQGLSALDPGELFLVNLPSFCPVPFPVKVYLPQGTCLLPSLPPSCSAHCVAHQPWYWHGSKGLYADLPSVDVWSLMTPGPSKMKVVHCFKTFRINNPSIQYINSRNLKLVNDFCK